MKYLQKYIIFTFLLLILSCDSDDLSIPPLLNTEESFFSTEGEFNQAILGIYQKLIFFYNYNGGNWSHGLWLAPDDNLTLAAGRSTAFETFVGINDQNGIVRRFFELSYQTLNRANTVLEIIEEDAGTVLADASVKNTFQGEALFLRGYINFLLWNYFGTAPLVTNRIDVLDESTPPNSEGTQLLDQAIADFEQASGLLPESWDEANLGRVFRGSAQGMLAKALVFRASITNNAGDYSAAIAAADQVIGSGNFSLEPLYADLFDEALENGPESLFEVQLGRNVVINNVWLNNDGFAVVGDLGGFWGFFDGNFGLFANPRFEPTQGLINSFEEGDPRIPSIFNAEENTITKYVERPRIGGNPDFLNNARILRLADVMLLKAEAIVGSGGDLSEAISLVNEIRARARNSVPDTLPPATVPADIELSISNPDEVLQLIMEERRRELAFEEGHRWLDLRRMHLGGTIDLSTLDFGSIRNDFEFDVSKNLVLPIPFDELSLNSNLRQNPGF